MPCIKPTAIAAFLFMVWITASGCVPDKPSVETLKHHVWLNLDGAWDSEPWVIQRDQRGVRLPRPATMKTQAAFELPENLVGHGSILQLEGLTWTADVSLNGHALPQVTGGVGLVEVELSNRLRAGRNTIEIEIRGSDDIDSLWRGHDDSAAQLIAPPRIVLRPRIGLDQVSAALTDDGVRLHAQTRNAPIGSQIHFEGWRDGQRFVDWGLTPVVDGAATLNAKTWTGDHWPGTPESSPLFMLKATLLTDEGETIDSGAWRTGLRSFEVTDGNTQLNGKAHRLLGVRHHDAGLKRGLEVMAPAGLNLVEFHGEMPKRTDLEMADELGVALAILPRCDGRLQTDLPKILAAKDHLANQDQAMLNQVTHSPSVLIWSTEGSGLHRKGQSVGRRLVANMRKDTIDRLVAGWDMPAFAIPVASPGNQPLDDEIKTAVLESEPFWVLEFHLTNAPHRPQLESIVQAVQESFEVGAMGGVLPGMDENNAKWAPAWAKQTQSLGVVPLSPEGRRSHSRVELTGLRPGEVVSLVAPGAPHISAVGGPDGRGQLSLWHHGIATLQTKRGDRTLQLLAGQWTNLEWTGKPARVNLEPHP